MLLVLISLSLIMFMPLILAMASILPRTAQFGKPDYENPRAQADDLTGVGHRIVAAQSNAWEALALFIAALAICSLAGLSFSAIAYPTVLFVGARISHAVFYIAGKGILRFLSFVASMVALIWILVLAFQAI